jgi:hypothetical protein
VYVRFRNALKFNARKKPGKRDRRIGQSFIRLEDWSRPRLQRLEADTFRNEMIACEMNLEVRGADVYAFFGKGGAIAGIFPHGGQIKSAVVVPASNDRSRRSIRTGTLAMLCAPPPKVFRDNTAPTKR